MKKLVERIIIFIIGVPAVAALVLFLPFMNNLASNIIVIIFSGIGAVEFSSMLVKKQIKISMIESFIFGSLTPLALTLFISLNFSVWIIPAFIMCGSLWALLSRVFSRSTEIENIMNQIGGSFALLVYPGFFMCWIVFMSGWGNPAAILLFLCITFGNDSLAWLFGSIFGEKNRGIVAVSPNKSAAGFIGGILGSVIVAAGAALLFPEIFPKFAEHGIQKSSLAGFACLLGILTSIAASLGDLAESAMKRSCDFKDSGNLMLGRGGVLDSIDSVAAAAPVFYLLFTIFFQC
ncbi:MAG: phosphatidate cytidylyltransferase [Treponema sp.]|nr:phosphatidate cytidylyltransferase [Treponema sp.]